MLLVVVNIHVLLSYIVVCCRYCYHGQPKYGEIIDTMYDICCFRGVKTEFLDKMESGSVLYIHICCFCCFVVSRWILVYNYIYLYILL